MGVSPPDILARLERYVQRREVSVLHHLGAGIQGIVVSTGRSAVKVLRRELHYQRERDVYLRLRQHDLVVVRGCAVPVLIDCDDELRALEMSIVKPPYILDFASAYLDRPPEYPPEVIDTWREEKQEQFGTQWPEIQMILWEFERYGIYLADVSPSNIRLLD